MKKQFHKHSLLNQYLISIFSVIIISTICYIGTELIGYRSVALLLLATVSVLAIFFSIYPILIAATLSALIWDFFFIPPHFTFHVESYEDILMLLMYFIIALLNGVLTSKIRSYEKKEQQKEEQQNTLRLYKTIFNSISHELRTPISTIVGASDNLLHSNSNFSEHDKKKLASEISIAAFRLNRLIDNLLNMQRLESGQLKLKLEWCEITELINSSLNRLQHELTNFNVELEIEQDFPLVKLDFGLMEQAIFNILHNSTIYTPINSIIKINCKLDNKYIVIEISDNGNGFTDEDLKNIFNKFYRNNQTKTGGLGLGLSIVKGYVEAHNGYITIEKNIPNGAMFVLKIPSETIHLNENSEAVDLIK